MGLLRSVDQGYWFLFKSLLLIVDSHSIVLIRNKDIGMCQLSLTPLFLYNLPPYTLKSNAMNRVPHDVTDTSAYKRNVGTSERKSMYCDFEFYFNM